MVSEQFDRCHGILLQYVEFLSSAITPIAYAQLIPPLQDLVHQYHIEPEVVHFSSYYLCSLAHFYCWVWVWVVLLISVLFFRMGKQVLFIFKCRLLSLYTAQWCDFLRARMVVTLVGLLMITRKENLYHLMILSCILTRLRNQSCKSSMTNLVIFDQYACLSLHSSWFYGEMIWLYCCSII